jgi:hypothetical protein
VETVAILAGVAIVALVAIFRNGNGSVSSTVSAPASDSTAGALQAVTGPAVQLLQEQPGSTAGQSGSGSMAPSGARPPVPNTPTIIAPRQPVRYPVNTYPAPRFRLPAAPTPRPPAVNFMGTKTRVTFQQ